MTIKKSKMIQSILKEIEENGFSSRQSYSYKLQDGQIIKVNPFSKPVVSVYATKEEVDIVKKYLAMRNY